MRKKALITTLAVALILTLAAVLAGCGSQPAAPAKTTLTLYGAGTLAKPFKAVIAAFEAANPNVTFQAQYGGSVKMAEQITKLHEPADLLAVADYHVIPDYLFGKNGQKSYADWYVGFVSNAITFVYTPKSKGAGRINDRNWYQVLAQPGVQIGRSNPNTDPSGYQTLQMLQLAGRYYHQPGLESAILKNSPQTNMRDTETELLGALESGQIDYLAIYRSDAIQHKLKYLNLPVQINLSNPAYATDYARSTAATKNGNLKGAPIIYAITVTKGSPNKALADKFIDFLVSPAGQKIMNDNGFHALSPAPAFNRSQAPADIQQATTPWPGK
ncbi:MAG: extracellular solute-binding protein [Peptococcaceae bacterium]|jgi:molybdate/tungstate transport system substrate-binding protein|nr:extracellular solute-binding protein [Peptococcaceae bacterium]